MAAIDLRELCNICQERYEVNVREPIALGCGHSFCRPCIFNMNQIHSVVQCPDCSRVHEGERPEAAATNYELLHIVESISRQRRDLRTCKEEKEKDDDKGNADLKKKSCHDSDSSDSDSDEEDIKKKKNKNEEEKKEEPESNPEDDEEAKFVSVVQKPKTQRWCFSDNVKRKSLLWGTIISLSVIGGLLSAYCIAPAALSSWGFTKNGAVKNSYAAEYMSKTGKANNGTIPKDSWASWYQAAGQKGFDTDGLLIFFVSGFIICLTLGVVVASLIYFYMHISYIMQKYKAIQLQEVPLTKVHT